MVGLYFLFKYQGSPSDFLIYLALKQDILKTSIMNMYLFLYMLLILLFNFLFRNKILILLNLNIYNGICIENKMSSN